MRKNKKLKILKTQTIEFQLDRTKVSIELDIEGLKLERAIPHKIHFEQLPPREIGVSFPGLMEKIRDM